MKILPRQFILVASELFGGDLRQIETYRSTLKDGQIMFAEYVALVDWTLEQKLGVLWTKDCWDAKMRSLRDQWEEIAKTHTEDFDETEDQEWIAADKKINERYEQLRKQLLKRVDPELHSVYRESERAYASLAVMGSSSLHTDPKVIPTHAMKCPESYQIIFSVQPRPKAA